eukprot:466476_1
MLLFVTVAIAFYAVEFVNSQCDTGGYTCTPTLPPNNDCPGPATNDYVCSSFQPTNACYNEESLCAACCRADWLFLNDMSGGAYNAAQGLFDQQCQQDACTTLDPTQSPTEPSTNPSKYPSISPTEPSSAPSTNPSVTPTQPSSAPSKTPSVTPSNNPSVTPSNNPSVTPSNNPSVTPSNNPSVTPSNNPSVTPSNNPSVTPSNNPSV